MDLLLNPVTTNTEKSELFSVFFASVFMTKVSQTSVFIKSGLGGYSLPVVYND